MTIDNRLIVPKTIHLKRLDEKSLIMFEGNDGKSYETSEGLQEANRAYFARMHPFKVSDAIEGRREIAPGTGEVKVCVGFKKERDAYGMRREVPVYITKRF